MILDFVTADFKCDVTVFSHSDNKKEDALKMGAKQFVNTSHENWVKEAGEDYDIIVSTRGNKVCTAFVPGVRC